MKAWKIGEEDARNLLGGISSDRYTAMREAPLHKRLPNDMLIRISHLVGIFRALHTAFGHKLANTWMPRPITNSMFAGATPLAYCLEHGIARLKKVRRLLDALCEGY